MTIHNALIYTAFLVICHAIWIIAKIVHKYSEKIGENKMLDLLSNLIFSGKRRCQQ